MSAFKFDYLEVMVMNINNVYVCDIYRLDKISYNNFDFKNVDIIHGLSLDDCLCVKRKVSFYKKALVYYSVIHGGFIDMETKKLYNLGYPNTIGQLFIDVHKSKIYGKTLMGSNKKHYSKKRILKRYNEYKNADTN